MVGQFSVEPVGKHILVRFRGWPTEALLEECQQRMLEVMKASGRRLVLWDAREMYTPPFRVLLFQGKLDADLRNFDVCRAIVVSSPRLAYLSRLAYGEGNYRVFYDSIGPATKWLEDPLRSGGAEAPETWSAPGPGERRTRERRLSQARAGTGRRAADQPA